MGGEGGSMKSLKDINLDNISVIQITELDVIHTPEWIEIFKGVTRRRGDENAK